MIGKFMHFLRSIEQEIENEPGHSIGMVRRLALMLGIILAASFGVSYVHPEPVARKNGVSISHPWSKGGAVRQQSMPIYMTIENKHGVANALLHIESPMAKEFVITSVVKKEGIVKQHEALAIPPRERVVLQPGQMAITLVNLNVTIQPGEQIPVSMIFERAGKLAFKVRVENPGEPEHADHF
jgi:periplasmic copper chaperone A